MFSLEDEAVLFLYCWTFNEMQIPATRGRREPRSGVRNDCRSSSPPDGSCYTLRRPRYYSPVLTYHQPSFDVWREMISSRLDKAKQNEMAARLRAIAPGVASGRQSDPIATC